MAGTLMMLMDLNTLSSLQNMQMTTFMDHHDHRMDSNLAKLLNDGHKKGETDLFGSMLQNLNTGEHYLTTKKYKGMDSYNKLQQEYVDCKEKYECK